MSDETPTEKFYPPTEPFEPHEPESAPASDKEAKSRTLIIVLSVIGGLLLIVAVVLLTLLFARGTGGASENPAPTLSPSATESSSPSPSASASPSETPSASPSATQPPAPQGPRFTTFNVPESQHCSAGGPGVPPTRPIVTVSWATAGTDQAWFVNGTSDAADAQFMQIPLNGNQNDFQNPQEINCSSDKATFTITLVGPDGKHVNKSWTVSLTGDRF